MFYANVQREKYACFTQTDRERKESAISTAMRVWFHKVTQLVLVGVANDSLEISLDLGQRWTT